MKDLNINFVGFFIKRDDKNKFVNLFQCKEKRFLEGKYTHTLSENSNIEYFPEILYKSKISISLNKNILVNIFVKKLYKTDLRDFKGAKEPLEVTSTIKLILLTLVYSFTQHIKRNTGFAKWNIFKIIYKTYKIIKRYKKNDPLVKKRLMLYKFRLNFISGYAYSNNLLENRVYNKTNDVYVLWGKSYSSRLLLKQHLRKRKIPFFIAEYGEVPGTISFSPKGIFGETFSKESWSELYNKKIDSNDLTDASKVLSNIKEDQISTRNYLTSMYFLIKYFYDNSVHTENKQKVVYVNGSELFSSGLYDKRWNIDNEGMNPNKMLLQKVVSYFKDTNYMIMFKEHPMMIHQSTKALVKRKEFPTVNFLVKTMNIHDILEISDIVVSFPSKVVITSLIYKKPTFVLGDFTIINSIPAMNYFTSRNFNDISQLEKNSSKYNEEELIEFTARILKYTLIIFDENLHKNFNKEFEIEKIKITLSSKNEQYKL